MKTTKSLHWRIGATDADLTGLAEGEYWVEHDGAVGAVLRYRRESWHTWSAPITRTRAA